MLIALGGPIVKSGPGSRGFLPSLDDTNIDMSGLIF